MVQFSTTRHAISTRVWHPPWFGNSGSVWIWQVTCTILAAGLFEVGRELVLYWHCLFSDRFRHMPALFTALLITVQILMLYGLLNQSPIIIWSAFSSHSQHTPHSLPVRASYRVSFVNSDLCVLLWYLCPGIRYIILSDIMSCRDEIQLYLLFTRVPLKMIAATSEMTGTCNITFYIIHKVTEEPQA